MSAAARRRLLAYDWPGNVRQLRNVVESMVVVDYDGLLDVDDLPEELAGAGRAGRRAVDRHRWPRWSASRWTEIERLFIAETLRLTGGNREEAAEMLGIGERTLYRKIKEYGLCRIDDRVTENRETRLSQTLHRSCRSRRNPSVDADRPMLDSPTLARASSTRSPPAR